MRSPAKLDAREARRAAFARKREDDIAAAAAIAQQKAAKVPIPPLSADEEIDLGQFLPNANMADIAELIASNQVLTARIEELEAKAKSGVVTRDDLFDLIKAGGGNSSSQNVFHKVSQPLTPVLLSNMTTNAKDQVNIYLQYKLDLTSFFQGWYKDGKQLTDDIFYKVDIIFKTWLSAPPDKRVKLNADYDYVAADWSAEQHTVCERVFPDLRNNLPTAIQSMLQDYGDGVWQMINLVFFVRIAADISGRSQWTSLLGIIGLGLDPKETMQDGIVTWRRLIRHADSFIEPPAGADPSTILEGELAVPLAIYADGVTNIRVQVLAAVTSDVEWKIHERPAGRTGGGTVT